MSGLLTLIGVGLVIWLLSLLATVVSLTTVGLVLFGIAAVGTLLAGVPGD